MADYLDAPGLMSPGKAASILQHYPPTIRHTPYLGVAEQPDERTRSRAMTAIECDIEITQMTPSDWTAKGGGSP